MAGLLDRARQFVAGLGTGTSQDAYGTSVDSPSPLALDEGKVTIDFKKVVGVGSFATVYQGKYKGNKCAVKVYNTGAVRKDIERESQLASIIRHHPKVVLVHGLWYGNPANKLPDKQPALVMELCSTTLWKYLNEKKEKGNMVLFKLVSRLVILRDVAEGMIYLHGEQIVHGDLTAINVLVNIKGSDFQVAKVADFGQSRILDSDTAGHITATRGKKDIMPPEVKANSGLVELTKAVDLFSFGCLIPHVASCVYPEPRSDPLGAMSEYDKRAHYISDNHKHVFEPMMKRCLDDRPSARGTFTDILGDVQDHLTRYSKNKHVETLDEKQGEIERMKSEILTLQRQLEDLQKEHAALGETCQKVQDTESSMKSSWDALVRERDILADEKKSLEHKVMLEKQEVLRMQQKVEDLEKDKEQSLSTVGSVGVIFEKYDKAKEEIKAQMESVKQLTEENLTLSQKHTDSVAACKQLCEDKQNLQNKVARLSNELQERQKSLDREKGEKVDMEQQKVAAANRVKELQRQITAMEKKSKKAEQDLTSSMTNSQQLTRTNQEMTTKATQKEKELKELKEKIASLERQLTETKRLKAETVRERDSARVDGERTKQELGACQVQLVTERTQHQQAKESVKAKIAEIERLKAAVQQKDNDLWTVTKDKERFQGRASAGEATVKSQKEELKGAQEKIQELNNELRRYRDNLESMEKAKDKHKQAEEKLVKDKSSLNDEVRRLTFKLEAKGEENDKKQKEIYGLMKEVEVAQGVIEKGETLVPQLKLQIKELDDDLKDLMDKQAKTVGKLKGTESELKEAREAQTKLEEDRDQKNKFIRELESERDRTASIVQELDKSLSKMTAVKEELEGKLDEEVRNRRLMQEDSARALEKTAELQEQLKGLHNDYENLRKGRISDLHARTDFIEELWESEQQKDADLVSADVDYQALQDKLKATAEDRAKAAEQVELLQQSLSRVSAECEAMKKEKESVEQLLKATRQRLKTKVDECNTFEGAQLNLLQRCEELQREKQHLHDETKQMRAERMKTEAENEALGNQLKEFAAVKAENELLRNDAAEQTAMIKHWKKKAKKLTELESQLKKEQMELITEKKVVAELKRKLDKEFVTKTNLESAVKQSFRESFTERGEELLNESGNVGSGSGGSEGSEDSLSNGWPPGRRDMELLAQYSQQRIRDIEEGKWKTEEALGQKQKDTLQLQNKLAVVQQENVRLKDDKLVADKKAQESDMKTRMLAESYFQSHQYPPFLYHLNQKELPSNGIERASRLCNVAMAEVSAITDLRDYQPDESWCDELHFLLEELRAMPSKDRQASVSFSFLHCGGVVTFYRFHVVLVPQVLSREPEIHPIELEGGAKPKAMLVYAYAQLTTKNLKKEFGITAHVKGILLYPQFEGDISTLASRLDEMQLTGIPTGLVDTERLLDARILRELQSRYKVFATPRIVPTVPPMGVAMAVI